MASWRQASTRESGLPSARKRVTSGSAIIAMYGSASRGSKPRRSSRSVVRVGTFDTLTIQPANLLLDRPRPLRHHVAGVLRGDRLDEHHPALLCGHRIVAHPARHDDELAGPERDVAILELDAHRAPDDEEELVLSLVRVPDELALQPRDLDVLVVHSADHLRRPELGDVLEPRLDVDRCEHWQSGRAQSELT